MSSMAYSHGCRLSMNVFVTGEFMARILIAEDDKNIGELYREEFESDGHTVEVVANGLSALERAKDWQPHVVILDIGLPEMSGLDVLANMCSGGTPVIVNTAYPLFQKDFRSYRARAWIDKSSNVEPLKEVVRQTLLDMGKKNDN